MAASKSRARERAAGAAREWAAVREDLRRVPMARQVTTIVFIILAVLLARYSWETPLEKGSGPNGEQLHRTLPLLPSAERSMYDIRATFAALTTQTSPKSVAQRRGKKIADLLGRGGSQTAEADAAALTE